jgi:hypothetical protein
VVYRNGSSPDDVGAIGAGDWVVVTAGNGTVWAGARPSA